MAHTPAPPAPTGVGDQARLFVAELDAQLSATGHDPQAVARAMRELLGEPEFADASGSALFVLREAVYRLLDERAAVQRMVTIVTLGQRASSQAGTLAR